MLLAKAKAIFAQTNQAIAGLLKSFDERYEPSKHYMRGPGPKAKAAAMRKGSVRDRSKAHASS
ncbi:hypothetical protein X566_16620 [Afipia sp. P52-10]|nr:hypothetical protein X566_16620 [Afipia sp. P52-10]